MTEGLMDTSKLSIEEKLQYYRNWEASGLSVAQYCKEQHLSEGFIYYWRERYKKKGAVSEGFSCVKVKQASTPIKTAECNSLPVGMKWPNEVQLQMTLTLQQLVELIRGVCDATETLR